MLELTVNTHTNTESLSRSHTHKCPHTYSSWCPKSDKHCNEADVLSTTHCPTDELLVLRFTLSQRESDQILQFPTVTPITPPNSKHTYTHTRKQSIGWRLNTNVGPIYISSHTTVSTSLFGEKGELSRTHSSRLTLSFLPTLNPQHNVGIMFRIKADNETSIKWGESPSHLSFCLQILCLHQFSTEKHAQVKTSVSLFIPFAFLLHRLRLTH